MKQHSIRTYLPKALLWGLLCVTFCYANSSAVVAGKMSQSVEIVEATDVLSYAESNSAGRDLGLAGGEMALGAPSARIASAERTISCGRTSFQTSSQGRPTSTPRRMATQFCKSGKCIDINQTGRVVVLLWLWPSDLFSPQSMLINLRRLRL